METDNIGEGVSDKKYVEKDDNMFMKDENQVLGN